MTPQRGLMLAQMVSGAGFIAALDQSGGSTPKALRAFGIPGESWSGDAEMYDLIHQMRVRIITARPFTGDRVLAAILFERTMDGTADGVPVPTALWNRGIVPFLKVDRGLEAEGDGVQLMKAMPDLDVVLCRAKRLGVFGTKMRSVIKAASPTGIKAVVAQQFRIGAQISATGLLPILEPEVALGAADRPLAESILHDALLGELDALPRGQRVMLKLTIPFQPNHYADLIGHPGVVRVVALSGGYSRQHACDALARNKGMIASFSRALLADLKNQMDEAQFNAALETAVHEIYTASTVKAH